MPPDDLFVTSGADVGFPQDGPSTASADMFRSSASAFVLTRPGIYRVSVQVSVQEAGQLVLTLDGTELPYTVVGRATGTSQIVMDVLVEATGTGSVLTVRNPAANGNNLTITPLAGGTQPSSATLLIERLDDPAFLP
jgi:hypothetical protein